MAVLWRVKCDWLVLYRRLHECGECDCNYECQCDRCCIVIYADLKFGTLFEAHFALSIAPSNK